MAEDQKNWSKSPSTSPGSSLRPDQKAARRRLIIAGIVGNALEWYDFAIYGYFAAIIGKHFFPARDVVGATLNAYGAFAAGFLMRPIGGLLFGHIGDRASRRLALMLSVLAMAIPTFLIGVLPDYAQIGITATILMVVLRMIQGLSVGGEYTTSVVLLVEWAEPRRRGFMGSWSVFGAVAGILLGSAAATLINVTFSPSDVETWAWRIPFLGGLIVGLLGFYIRQHIADVPMPAVPREKLPGPPVVEAFRGHWWEMLQVGGWAMLNGVSFYMIFVYVVTYLQQVVHISAKEALTINTANMMVMLLLIPIAGATSDRLGRKPLLVGSTLGLMVFAWPLFWMLGRQSSSEILLGQLGFALLMGVFLGIGAPMMAQIFRAEVRCSALAIAYNVSLTVFGGTTPAISAYLVARTHNNFAPAFYLMVVAAASSAVILTIKEPPRSQNPRLIRN
jgi:MFS transporter, MHS family, proline/betaine transporter